MSFAESTDVDFFVRNITAHYADISVVSFILDI